MFNPRSGACHSFPGRNLLKQLEEAPFPFAVDRPVHWNALVSVNVFFVFHSKIKVTPRSVHIDGRNEVVFGPVKQEMVVLVKKGLAFFETQVLGESP